MPGDRRARGRACDRYGRVMMLYDVILSQDVVIMQVHYMSRREPFIISVVTYTRSASTAIILGGRVDALVTTDVAWSRSFVTHRTEAGKQKNALVRSNISITSVARGASHPYRTYRSCNKKKSTQSVLPKHDFDIQDPSLAINFPTGITCV